LLKIIRNWFLFIFIINLLVSFMVNCQNLVTSVTKSADIKDQKLKISQAFRQT
jgi:hypothetical protein